MSFDHPCAEACKTVAGIIAGMVDFDLATSSTSTPTVPYRVGRNTAAGSTGSDPCAPENSELRHLAQHAVDQVKLDSGPCGFDRRDRTASLTTMGG